MVAVTKKNGTLRICLDPKDLNHAIWREHYPLLTIEDVASCLYGAKLFIILDVKNGFWHVALDKQSSFLTTFYVHAIWTISMEQDALWYLFNTGDFSAKDARTN